MQVLAAERSVLEVANSPVLWVCAVGVFLIIIVQSVIYMKAAKKAAPAVGLTDTDLKTAFRTGAITAMGPSMAVVFVAIALLSIFGGPAVLVRIGLVGSAAYETGAGSVAAATTGAELGGESYTASVFALIFAAITLGGICWMLTTLLLTPILRRGDAKIRAANPLFMSLIPAAAMIAAFVSLGVGTFAKGPMNIVAFLVSGVTMAALLLINKKLNLQWVREWALGIALLVTFTVLYFVI